MTYVTSLKEPASIGTNGQTYVLSYATTSFGYMGWGASIPTSFKSLKTTVATTASGESVPLTSLAFTFTKSGKYMIDGCFLVQTAAATTGIQFTISTSKAVSVASFVGLTQLANTGTGTLCNSDGSAAYVGTTSGLPDKDTPYPMMVKALLVGDGTNAGTAVIRFKPETGTDIVKVLSGSSFVITQIA